MSLPIPTQFGVEETAIALAKPTKANVVANHRGEMFQRSPLTHQGEASNRARPARRRRISPEPGEKVPTLLAAATSQLDRAAGKNLIHANKARRTKSRLNKLVNKSAQ